MPGEVALAEFKCEQKVDHVMVGRFVLRRGIEGRFFFFFCFLFLVVRTAPSLRF